jgi:TPR repeat protein
MKIELGHPMKFVFKAFLFVLFALNLSLPSHADTIDRAIFAYDEGDYETAISIFSSLANGGDKTAKGYLVSSYIAVEDYDSLKQHLPEIEKLAQSGDANFQYILGIALSLDVDGIGNIQEAKRWLISAAELGNADAVAAIEELESEAEINQLEKSIALVQALSPMIAIVLALAALLFSSFFGSGAQAVIKEIFVIAVSFSLWQTLIDATYVMPALSPITSMVAVHVIFFLVIYFIIRKYLSFKID